MEWNNRIERDYLALLKIINTTMVAIHLNLSVLIMKYNYG